MKELKFTVGKETAAILTEMVALEIRERGIERLTDLVERPYADEAVKRSDLKSITQGFREIAATMGAILQDAIRNHIEQTPIEDLESGEPIEI